MTDLERLLFDRKSCRAFLDDPIPRADLERLCLAARSAPSGANLQPGSFHVLVGHALDALKTRLADAVEAETPLSTEYSYFPRPMPAELKARQRAAGYALYSALGIDRRDIPARKAQFDRNYDFFGAPAGVVVTIDRAMGKGCFMDLGMAIMSLLMAAEAMGYGATGIGALANYGQVVHKALELPPGELVVCGVAIGRADPDAPANTVRTAREPLESFTSFRGFTDSR